MQHEVYPSPALRNRKTFPFVVVLQSDFAEGDDRIVAPLMVELGLTPFRKAIPLVAVNGLSLRLLLVQMHPLHRRYLRSPIASVAAYRDDIVRALDWLFTGI